MNVCGKRELYAGLGELHIFPFFCMMEEEYSEWRQRRMRLKNVLIVVKDVEKSRQFYHDLFGLETVLDSGGNLILTEGLVLQDEKLWREALGREVVSGSHSCELYFEESRIEGFVEKLERLYPSVRYVTPLTAYRWGKKVVRFYDLDGNLIEVGTPSQEM